MLAVLFALSFAAAQCQCIVQENALCQGEALSHSDNVSAPDKCCAMCSVTVGCKSWTLSRDGHCILKKTCIFIPTTIATLHSTSGVLRRATAHSSLTNILCFNATFPRECLELVFFFPVNETLSNNPPNSLAYSLP